jgi:hypothetical protein
MNIKISLLHAKKVISLSKDLTQQNVEEAEYSINVRNMQNIVRSYLYNYVLQKYYNYGQCYNAIFIDYLTLYSKVSSTMYFISFFLKNYKSQFMLTSVYEDIF